MSVDTLTKCGACLGPFSLCRSIFSVGSDGGARRAARQPCPAPKKCPGVVFQGAVWCGSVATLVADRPFTRPALKRCFSLVLPAPSPSGRPSARPPPAHPLPPNPGLFRAMELATGPSMGVAATAAVGLGARIAWAVPCVVRRGESGKGWIRGLFEKQLPLKIGWLCACS